MIGVPCNINLTASDCIAIIAIIMSLLTLVIELKAEKKRNERERIIDLYNQAYKDLLLEVIPAAVSRIKYTKNGVVGTGVFGEACKELRRNSGFFQFFDMGFYEHTVAMVMEVEDFVLDMDNKVFSRDVFEGKRRELNERLKKLYDQIMDKCL